MAKGKKEEDRQQVGTVKVTYVDPDFGKRVERVPVYEGEDPDAVAVEARLQLGYSQKQREDGEPRTDWTR